MKLRHLASVALFPLLALGQDLNYLVYDTDHIPPSEYAVRRKTLRDDLGKDALAIFVSAPPRTRNADTNYEYRQDDNFFYLTGFEEPNAILLISAKGFGVRNLRDSTLTDTVHEIIFVQPRDPRWEQWTGRRFGPEGTMKLLGLEYAVTNDKVKDVLTTSVSSSSIKSLYVVDVPSEVSRHGADPMQPLREFIEKAKGGESHPEMRDAAAAVKKYRAVKSPGEIALITKAAHISALAHRQAMMSCKPGMAEYELQAVFEYVFRRYGSEYNAYPCIVGASENSVILHYDTNRRPIKDGDIVLTDCAAEYHNYASDVTRTFPANGKFSAAQREVYQIVLNAQNAAIALMKPGTQWRDVTAKADSVLEAGLLTLGIIKEKNGKDFRKFYPHGLGHAVGLDVHDIGSVVMVPGVVYTVEPGIYIPDSAPNVPAKYSNIGVRIEDDILITSSGNKILSAEAPREMDEIESLMKKKGIADEPVE